MRDAVNRFRACRCVPDLLAMAVIAGVVWMRSQAAFERGTYLHEGGRWLTEQWNGGVGHALGAIRPDYLTVGNQVVIAVADGLTRLFGGTRLAAAGPMWQHGVSVVWIVAVMMPVWWCLRRNLPLAAAAAAMVMMLVVPDSQMPPALALSVLVVELPLIVELIRLSVEEQKIPPAELAAAVQVLPEMRQLLMFKVPDAP